MYNLTRGPEPGKLFHPKGRGNGYVLAYGGKRFYFSGDTEGTPAMKALKNIDVAFVCMNLPYTMPPDEAAQAVRAFRPKIVLSLPLSRLGFESFREGSCGQRSGSKASGLVSVLAHLGPVSGFRSCSTKTFSPGFTSFRRCRISSS